MKKMADEQIEDTPTITDPGAEPEEAVPKRCWRHLSRS